ncbi:MAG: DUF4368 domain-containing protein [Clostridiales bacterium]|nr:DUF4368 domain-containing protein [Clostridiales bacterium]
MNKIYEDNALGGLPGKRYESLLETYGQEQEALEAEIAEIRSAAEKYEDDNGRAERLVKLAERCTDFEEAAPAMIRELIEKIVVHEREMPMARPSPQKVEIHLSFIGELELSGPEIEPAPEELAERERMEKEREYNRRRYIKGKASGYYDKPQAKAVLSVAANQ